MKSDYAHALLSLPVDATLRLFLERCGLKMAAGFTWEDTVPASEILVDVIHLHEDAAVRDTVIASLNRIGSFQFDAGRAAIGHVVGGDEAILLGLDACRSDVHRALWLYVHYPHLFERAEEVFYFDGRQGRALQHDLGIKAQLRREPEAVAAFCQAIRDFFRSAMGRGEICIAHVLDRPSGVQLVTVYAKDAAEERLEFQGAELVRRISHPNIHISLEYAPETGMLRTIMLGGAKAHAALAHAFAAHLLGEAVEAQSITRPELDLTRLQAGFDVPEALQEGFAATSIKSLTLQSDDGNLRIEISTTGQQQQCVTQMVRDYWGDAPFLDDGYTVIAAQLNFYRSPKPGRKRCPVVSVETTAKGRLNLHRFDEGLRAQLERYLISFGILKPEHALYAAEAALV